MKHRIALASSVLLASVSVGTIASAANVYDYVQTFDGSGTFDGKSFTNKLITLESSTTSAPFLSYAPNGVYNDESPTVQVSGTLNNGTLFSAILEAPAVIYSFSYSGEVGIGVYHVTYAGIYASSLFGFDLSYSLGPVVGLASSEETSVPTTGGNFDLKSVTGNGTFEETVTPLSGVPEPGIWAMMIAGVAMIGSALRFNRKRGVALAA